MGKRNRKGSLRRRVMKRLVRANARLAEAAESLKVLSSILAPALRKEINKVVTSAKDYKAIHELLSFPSPAKEIHPVSKKSKEVVEQPAKKRGRPKQAEEEQPKRKRHKKSAE